MKKALHIECAKGDIAPLVLMPGDPLRAKYIALNFLDNPILINKVRNMFGYTGYYRNQRVTIMASGMGMPSMSIYAMELFKYYDVQKIIRVGTCGARQKDEKLLDLVLGTKYWTSSNFALSLNNEKVNEVYSSSKLNRNILNATRRFGKTIRQGTIITMDVFGPYASLEAQQRNNPLDQNVIAEEMEGFGLVYIAHMLGRQATCIATIVDSPFCNEIIQPQDREKSLKDMILIALEAIIK